ncbi:protein of unknown function [Xenorhabdus doucetiae]|uniref:Uncharacterized protein n=1 Tax=Xenorhabdus doucetiae TaxID=351671 RepID=A0A068QVL9_9GAMM|nr:protein of unknown function [Xenorhabdus doucetiae]
MFISDPLHIYIIKYEMDMYILN